MSSWLDVLQATGIILYPLCWVLHEEWVWLEIPAPIFQHPFPAVTGYNLILLHTRQRCQSQPERCPQTNPGQKEKANITLLHSLTTFTFLKVLFQSLCWMYTHTHMCMLMNLAKLLLPKMQIYQDLFRAHREFYCFLCLFREKLFWGSWRPTNWTLMPP